MTVFGWLWSTCILLWLGLQLNHSLADDKATTNLVIEKDPIGVCMWPTPESAVMSCDSGSVVVISETYMTRLVGRTDRCSTWHYLNRPEYAACRLPIPASFAQQLAENCNYTQQCTLGSFITGSVVVTGSTTCGNGSDTALERNFLVIKWGCIAIEKDPIGVCMWPVPESAVMSCDSGSVIVISETYLTRLVGRSDRCSTWHMQNRPEYAACRLPIPASFAQQLADNCNYTQQCTLGSFLTESVVVIGSTTCGNGSDTALERNFLVIKWGCIGFTLSTQTIDTTEIDIEKDTSTLPTVHQKSLSSSHNLFSSWRQASKGISAHAWRSSTSLWLPLALLLIFKVTQS